MARRRVSKLSHQPGLPIDGRHPTRLPFVAIVGRPNVGKSTLFNRLSRAPLSIVDPTPGVTRDRIYAEVTLRSRPVGLIDTGGIEAEGTALGEMADRIRLQVCVAIEEADIVVGMFDATTPPSVDDQTVVDLLRRSGRRVLWVANKVDRVREAAWASEYYRLGVDDLLPISAVSGAGVGELLDRILAALPPAEKAFDEEAELPPEDSPTGVILPPPVPRVAVIGRPNSGKSTLINRLLGTERMLVDERPGTTRDAVDTLLDTEGGQVVLIDTAGLRRRARIVGRLERLAALSAVRALERCHVAILLTDGSTDAGADQDRHLLGLAANRGRALIVAVNKVDLVRGASALRELDQQVRDAFAFAAYAPVHLVSARSGYGVDELLRTIHRVYEAFNRRIPTSELNRFLETTVERHSPPLFRNKPVRFLYVTQTAVRPPSFVFFTTRPEGVHASYVRYLENQLRERYGFDGCPVRLRFRRGRA